jgi:hypothetical protein
VVGGSKRSLNIKEAKVKSRDFAFWLQGFFELGGGKDGLSAEQVASIKQHLSLVFQHDTDIGAKPHPVSSTLGFASGEPLATMLVC